MLELNMFLFTGAVVLVVIISYFVLIKPNFHKKQIYSCTILILVLSSGYLGFDVGFSTYGGSSVTVKELKEGPTFVVKHNTYNFAVISLEGDQVGNEELSNFKIIRGLEFENSKEVPGMGDKFLVRNNVAIKIE